MRAYEGVLYAAVCMYTHVHTYAHVCLDVKGSVVAVCFLREKIHRHRWPRVTLGPCDGGRLRPFLLS